MKEMFLLNICNNASYSSIKFSRKEIEGAFGQRFILQEEMMPKGIYKVNDNSSSLPIIMGVEQYKTEHNLSELMSSLTPGEQNCFLSYHMEDSVNREIFTHELDQFLILCKFLIVTGAITALYEGFSHIGRDFL